jgi:hypothetical protein
VSKFVSETELSGGGLQRPENELKKHLGETKFGESLLPLTRSRCLAWRETAGDQGMRY